ncbi:hypothetical protein M406DRAFT_329991 [Cryphonectria parasitica EP155]|uniref:G domain-containing protein n=1 Tax=Cryphonectria parasitica (strain ATCC 38755 / EP155) TaxID=660469 RepID=A0A9P4Y469_CRYP1|nr:uncharacterized protein M406DRAFT_329991 [Cryphonectria parasitica EP155]KAF3766150.1 hypothetical protein M406DRAFT_329991 [Cryphonectria parasitica EP155]
MEAPSNYFDRLMSEASIEDLEKGVKINVERLKEIEEILSSLPESLLTITVSQVQKWLAKVKKLRDEAKLTRFTIGVIGNTGAGKSSLINALLDEERLVPVNGVRACTASATEIAYNYSDDPAEAYRAEIEFITAEGWSKELETLLSDMILDGKVSKDCLIADSPAGVVYAKIKAVYPKMKKHDMAVGKPCEMAQSESIRGLLGTAKSIHRRTASGLYDAVQKYVDSRDRAAGRGGDVEYWPLIRSVRIYCKAVALSTGAVIVDLPGVHDANTARGAVALNYLKVCDAIWITAGVQRAMDDKAAKELLGESFRRQLKFDGAYSAITFICTKTDDILKLEVASALDMGDGVSDLEAQLKDLEARKVALRRQLRELKQKRFASEATVNDWLDKHQVWSALSVKAAKGETVYRPVLNSKKRKHSGDSGNEDSGTADDSGDDGNTDGEAQVEEGHDRQVLTVEEIEGELNTTKDELHAAKKAKKALKKQCREADKELQQVGADESAMRSRIQSICIKGRNQMCKGAIKADFAPGIKELDQQTAMEKDEWAFDPNVEARDYDAVARSLPVFCVSARAYQKLTGKLVDENVQVQGFIQPDDTEIPGLQAHARTLTKAGRRDKARYLINDADELLNSMKIWTTSTRAVHMTKAEIVQRKEFLGKQLSVLDMAFEKLIIIGSEKAVAIAESWGNLLWSTYRATLLRYGEFSGAAGPRDFNAELHDPVAQHLASSWEMVFQRCVPMAFAAFTRSTIEAMEQFQHNVCASMPHRGIPPLGSTTMEKPVRIQVTALEASMQELRKEIDASQRDLNRMFCPAIREVMRETYDSCSKESGPGCYARRKNLMKANVETNKRRIFQEATRTVKDALQKMACENDAKLQHLVSDLLMKLERDFTAVLIGDEDHAAERELRSQLRKPLDDSDSWYAELFPDVKDKSNSEHGPGPTSS